MIILYIYIYIYCHPQIDYFVVSQLFNVVRHARCFKLGLKLVQIYARLSILPLCHFGNKPQLGNLKHFVSTFICLHFPLLDTVVLNSLEELCITRAAAVNSFARVLNPGREAYILSSTDRLFRCITTLQGG